MSSRRSQWSAPETSARPRRRRSPRRLRRRRARGHQGRPAAGQGTRHQLGGPGARLQPRDRRLERLRRDEPIRTSWSSRLVCREPGDMSRDDLVTTNEGIVSSVTREAVERSPEADHHRRLEPARRHVPRGQGRLRAGRASACSAWPGSWTPPASAPSSPGRRAHPPEDVTAIVLGGHGDQMVPVVSATTVGGIPLRAARLRRAHRGARRAHAQGRR